MLTVYHYPGCSTCRAALKWLDAKGIAHRRVHIVLSPPDARILAKAAAQLPLRKLFNTSGESYRAENLKERLPQLSESEALALLAANGKLIKRPFVVNGDEVLIGFSEELWEKQLSR